MTTSDAHLVILGWINKTWLDAKEKHPKYKCEFLCCGCLPLAHTHMCEFDHNIIHIRLSYQHFAICIDYFPGARASLNVTALKTLILCMSWAWVNCSSSRVLTSMNSAFHPIVGPPCRSLWTSDSFQSVRASGARRRGRLSSFIDQRTWCMKALSTHLLHSSPWLSDRSRLSNKANTSANYHPRVIKTIRSGEESHGLTLSANNLSGTL